MKNNLFKYGKKSLSVFLSALMLLTCWVWVAPEHSHVEAYADVNIPAGNGAAYAGSVGAYNTPVFDKNHDRWFKFLNGSDYTTIYYPSNIYLDKTETLQSAGYTFHVEWHFGDGTNYRILLGANVWGDHSQWSGYPDRYYAMTNAFNNYGVDASNPKNYPAGLYGSTDSSTNYDTRIIGYGYSGQGSDQFSVNGTTHTKYVLWRSNQTTNTATIYLKGTPKATGTYDYNTSGSSFGSYGLAQKYGSGSWSTHTDATTQFQSKGNSSSYMEGEWIEMQWTVTIYDKSALNTAVNTAANMVNNVAYTRVYREKLAAALSTARAVLTKRATTQTEIDNAKNTLQNLINAPEYRTYELTYENLFSLSDWWNSQSAINNTKRTVTVDLNAGKVTVQNHETVTSSEVVTQHSGSASTAGTRNTSYYSMPVTAGKSYTFKYTTDHKDTQMFAFFYDTNGGCTHSSTFGNYNFSAPQNGTGIATFTAPANSTRVEIRFDNNWYSSTANYWDIMVYETDRANEVELDTWTTRPIRKVYTYNTAIGTSLDTPVRPGYLFNKWMADLDNNGTGDQQVSDFATYQMTQSWVLYSDWSKKTLDVNYDNLFSFSDWYYSKSNGVNDSTRGTMTADVENGTMTFTATANDFFCPNNGAAGYYTATVEPNTTYVLSYDLALTGGGMQVGAWYYTDSLTASSVNAYNISYSEADGYYEFTTPSDCTKVAIRFGVTGANGVGTYSNIGIYEKAAYDDYADGYSKVREPFMVGDTDSLMYPSRDGYVFDGWELEDGTSIETVEGLTASTTVYATWTKLWTVTFYNGDASVLFTTQVKDGEAASLPVTTPTKASDDNYSYTFAGWDKTLTSITADTMTKPTFTSTAHTVAYDFVSDRTCEKNAMVDKTCSDCGYVFFLNGEYDGTEIAEYIKLGHSYNEDRIVTGTSTGIDGIHEIECVRYLTCGSTKAVNHEYQQGTTDGANCVTQGTVNWRCPCGQTKTTTGDYAPDVHENTRTINAKDPECLVDGYTGDTYCDDCKNTVKTGTAIAQLGHSFTNYVYNDDAKCEIDGSETAKCDRCDVTDTQTATGTALEHNWADTEKYLESAANCTDNEVYYKECSLCGISSESKDGATWTKADTAWGHEFDGAYVTNNNGTHVQKCTNTGCTATGNENTCTYGAWTTDNAVTHSHTCTACGYTPAAANHSWSDWTSTNAAGTTAGTQTRECTVCHREETMNCTYTSVYTAETCTTAAFTTYTCTDCGHGYTVVGKAATGHDFSGEVKTYSNGYHSYKCVNANCESFGFAGIANAREACSYSYTNTASGTHKVACTVCTYNYTDNCSGGQATCTAEAVCDYCKTAYGDKADHSFNGAVKVLDGDVHAYLCEFCGEDTGIYGIGNTVNDTEACSGGDATCTAFAECDICKDTHGELDTDDHKWGEAVTDTANAGKHIYTCEYNNAHTKSEACVSISSEVVAPKCEEEGYTIQTCKCGYEWNTDIVPATDHKWGALVSGKDGTHTYTCQNTDCTKTKTENCEDWKMQSGVAPSTCLEQGYTVYECDVCAHTWKDNYTEATGHSYTNKIRVLDAAYKRSEKTCTAAETYWYRCDNCEVSAGTEEDKYADNLASIYWSNGTAAGHKMEDLVDTNDLAKNRVSEATCTYPAVYYKSCSVCGAQDTATFTYGAQLGHDYQNLVDTDDLTKNRVSEATCTAAAVYYKSCAREDCNAVSTETFEYGTKLGHSMTKTDAKEADCDTAGNVEYYTCSTCKKNFSDEAGTTEISKIVIEALGHVWNSVGFKAATCEEDGHAPYKECTRCHEGALTEDQIYKATGHNFTGAYYCDTANNYHSKYCVNDGCTATGIVVDGAQVKYTVEYDGLDYVIKGGEKCTYEAGFEAIMDENNIHNHKLTCVCGNVTAKAFSDIETFVETVAPTCTEDGYDYYECPECDDTWEKNPVDATGHDFTDAVWKSNGDDTHSRACKNAGCTHKETADCSTEEEAVTECGERNICDICNTAFGAEVPHTWENTETYLKTKETCTAGAVYYKECSKCNASSEGKTDATWVKDNATGHSMITDYVFDIADWKYKPTDFNKEIKAPTCKTEGLGIIYCVNCSYYKTKTVKADSSAHVWACEVPGADLTDEERDAFIVANWENAGGNCATGVTYKNTCTVCDKLQTRVITVEHTFDRIIVDSGLTCTEYAYKVYECSVCGFLEERVDETVEPSHKWGEVIPDKEATCGREGRGYKLCTVCGATSEFEVIPAKGHAWDTNGDGITDTTPTTAGDYIYVEATAPKCTVDGYEAYYKCLECSYDQHLDERWLAEEGNFKPATGHVDANGDSKCDGAECGKTLAGDSSSDCGCICHKSNGFMKLIYKILCFFWKLFGIGKSCDCGAVHY